MEPSSPRKKSSSPSASMQKFLNVFKKKKRFSAEHLKELCDILTLNTEHITPGNKELVRESMRDMSEVLIWGDQHSDPTFLELFLERNMLQKLLVLLLQEDRDLKVQLIQTLGILVENVKDTSFLYCLLSNNHINNLIATIASVKTEEQEDLLAYYVSFLKTISLRLDHKSVQFFFNDQTFEFPLFSEAIKLFNHHEGMVRISIRVLTLNVFKLDLKALRKYLASNATPSYFRNVCQFIRRQCVRLGDLILKIGAKPSDHHQLDDCLAEINDNLCYIQDVFSLNIDQLNQILCKTFMQVVVFPFLFASLVPDSTIDDRIPPVAALFLLAQLFVVFKYKPLVDTVADFLLHPIPQTSLHEICPSAFPLPVIVVATTNPISPAQTPSSQTEKEEEEKQQTSTQIPTPTSNRRSSLPPLSLDKIHSDTKNPFRLALLNYVGGEDGFALGAECLFFSLMRNQVIDRELLEEAGILPYFQSKTRDLMNNLTTDQPLVMLQTPRSIPLPKGVKSWRVESPFISGPTDPLGGLSFDSHNNNTTPNQTTNSTTKTPSPTIPISNSTQTSEYSLQVAHSLPVNTNSTQSNTAITTENKSIDEAMSSNGRSAFGQEYLMKLVDKLLIVISHIEKYRIVTLQVCLILLKDLVSCPEAPARLTSEQTEIFNIANERAILGLKEKIGGPLAYVFLELFEEVSTKYKQVNVENLVTDASVLLPMVSSFASTLVKTHKLPEDEAESTQKSIQGFLILRDLKFSLSKTKDDFLPLKSLPLPDISSNSYFQIDPNCMYSQFTTAVVGKKVVIRYFVIIEGGLVILDLPLSADKPSSLSARRLSKPKAAIVQTVIPIQHIEIEATQEDILEVVSHKAHWSMKMGFSSRPHMLEARHLLESGRSKARTFKMKQIYKALGIVIEEIPEPQKPSPTSPATEATTKTTLSSEDASPRTKDEENKPLPSPISTISETPPPPPLSHPLEIRTPVIFTPPKSEPIIELQQESKQSKQSSPSATTLRRTSFDGSRLFESDPMPIPAILSSFSPTPTTDTNSTSSETSQPPSISISHPLQHQLP